MEMVGGHDLLIVCPYLGLDYLRRITRPAAGWRLLTDVGEWIASQAAGGRPAVVRFVAANADRVRHCPGLHAKVLIAGTRAMLGSANFTSRRMTRRVEMSVLFDGGPVEELRAWFESVWDCTGPVDEADLRAFARAVPPQPRRGPRLPSSFPGVAAAMAPTLGDVQPPLEMRGPRRPRGARAERAVGKLVARLSPPVRRLVRQLRRHLEKDGARAKTTRTAGGDIRHFSTRVNFSEMRFQTAAVVLRLRLGRGSIADPDLTWNPAGHGSPHLAWVRLPAGATIPAKVARWIARAKRYTAARHG